MAKRRGLSSTKSQANTCNAWTVADKGHFVVYNVEGKRFMVPLGYLKSYLFGELLKMSEDEFGHQGDGPIVLPCEAAFLEYALSILQSRASREVERELSCPLSGHKCSASSSFKTVNSQLASFLPQKRSNYVYKILTQFLCKLLRLTCTLSS